MEPLQEQLTIEATQRKEHDRVNFNAFAHQVCGRGDMLARLLKSAIALGMQPIAGCWQQMPTNHREALLNRLRNFSSQ